MDVLKLQLDIPRLESERLILRAYRPEDFDFYASLTGDPEVMRYIAEPAPRPMAFRFFCAAFGHWAVRGHGMWVLEEKLTGSLIGHAGLPHWEGSAGMEVGYALARSAWGQGYATEAATRVLRYAHEAMNARGVLSVIHPDNAASIRVVEKMGARYSRDHDGKTVQLRVYVHRDPPDHPTV